MKKYNDFDNDNDADNNDDDVDDEDVEEMLHCLHVSRHRGGLALLIQPRLAQSTFSSSILSLLSSVSAPSSLYISPSSPCLTVDFRRLSENEFVKVFHSLQYSRG